MAPKIAETIPGPSSFLELQSFQYLESPSREDVAPGPCRINIEASSRRAFAPSGPGSPISPVRLFLHYRGYVRVPGEEPERVLRALEQRLRAELAAVER